MEIHQALGYTHLEVIPMLTANEILLLKRLEEIDKKWQEATGYLWLDDGDYREMVKEAEGDPCEPDFTLEDLLAGITPENVHEEIQTGKPRGKEAQRICPRPKIEMVW